jgi:hypothetical protein
MGYLYEVMGMKGSMGHVMGWLDTFCWPIWHIQV